MLPAARIGTTIGVPVGTESSHRIDAITETL